MVIDLRITADRRIAVNNRMIINASIIVHLRQAGKYGLTRINIRKMRKKTEYFRDIKVSEEKATETERTPVALLMGEKWRQGSNVFAKRMDAAR